MKRIIDLTHVMRPGIRGVEIDPKHTIKKDGWNTTTLHLFSHAGTHLDAPKHFISQGQSIDALALEKCIGPARVIDLTFIKPKELITIDHLKPHADEIAAGNRLLFKTGWSSHVYLPDYRTDMPGVSFFLAEWLAKRKIALLGVEPPSVADVSNIKDLIAVHRVLLEAGVVLVEGLNNLNFLRTDTVTLIALPLKIERGDGSPARVIAIEECI